MAKNVIEMVIRLNDKASPSIKQVGGAAEKAGKQAKTSSTKWTEMASKLALLKVAANVAGKAIGSMFTGSKEFVAAGSQMEGFETRLNVLMGSSAAAKQRLDELFQIGSTTPFELPGLVEAEINLRALGVNAEEAMPMIMDFAGAMGVDVARAAVEVGRAMQFGAGAVETIAGRALRAQVELKTGGDALKMSTKEFKAALVETLTDEDGIFAGGTQKLAETFDGMLSNLKDSWFKFQKETADAGLFDTAKETLRGVLHLIGKNQEGISLMSKVFADGFVRSLFVSTKMMGYLVDGFLALGSAIMDISTKWTEMTLSIADVASVVGLGPSKEERAALESRLATLADTKDVLQDMGGFATMAEDLVAGVEHRVANLPKAMAAGVERAKPKDEDDEAPGPSKADIKAQEKARKDAAKAAAKQAETWDDMLLSLDEMNASMKALPFEMAAGVLDGMASPKSGILDAVGAMGPKGAAIAGMMGTLSSMGEKGAKAIRAELKGFIKSMIIGLTEVLPELIGILPVELIKAIPKLIGGLVKATPLIAKALFIDLPKQLIQTFGQWLVKAIGGFFRFFIDGMPKAIWQGVKKWFAGAWKTIKAALSDLNPLKKKGGIFTPQKAAGRVRLAAATLGASEVIRGAKGLVKGSMQTGGFVSDSGLHMLHAGERVVPSTGASTSAMQAAAGNIGSGQAITINTNVVDPNALESLGRLLDRQFGEKGRSRAGIFSNAEPLAGLV